MPFFIQFNIKVLNCQYQNILTFSVSNTLTALLLQTLNTHIKHVLMFNIFINYILFQSNCSFNFMSNIQLYNVFSLLKQFKTNSIK